MPVSCTVAEAVGQLSGAPSFIFHLQSGVFLFQLCLGALKFLPGSGKNPKWLKHTETILTRCINLLIACSFSSPFNLFAGSWLKVWWKHGLTCPDAALIQQQNWWSQLLNPFRFTVKHVKSSKTHFKNIKSVLLHSAFWVPLVVGACSSSSMYLGAFREAAALWATFSLARFFGQTV